MEDGKLGIGGVGERRMESPMVETQGRRGSYKEGRDGEQEGKETGEHGWEVRANQNAGPSR